MKKMGVVRSNIFCVWILLFFISANAAVFIQTAGAADELAQTVSLIVKLVNGLTPEEKAAVIARNGGVEISSIPVLRLHIVELSLSEISRTLSRYQPDSQVQSIELNNKRKVEGTPADPLYIEQWALPKIGWDAVFGSVVPIALSTVTVLDTGVDASHADLSGSLVAGTSVLDGTDPGDIGTKTETEGKTLKWFRNIWNCHHMNNSRSTKFKAHKPLQILIPKNALSSCMDG